MNLDHLKEEMKEAETLNEMWDVLDEHYDLDMPLKPIAKGMVIGGLIKHIGTVLTLTRTPERETV